MRKIDLGPSAESTIDDIAENLYRRIEKESTEILKEQLAALGVDNIDNIQEMCERRCYPENDLRMCSFLYEGKIILTVKIAENKMSIIFDIPNLKEAS